MTTIAYDGKTMAGDTLVSMSGFSFKKQPPKIKKCGNILLGASGAMTEIQEALDGLRIFADNVIFGVATGADSPAGSYSNGVLTMRIDEVKKHLVQLGTEGKWKCSLLLVDANDPSVNYDIDFDPERVNRWCKNSGYNATGSGNRIALTLMHIGYTAEKAVEVAAELDPGTGGEITVINVTDKGEV